jgi:hypothetical protein
MIQKIKNRLVILASVFALAMPALVPVTVHAAQAQDDFSGNLCSGTNIDITGGEKKCGDSTDGESGINDLLIKIVNVISAIVGVVAVIMIIFGGFKYITSGGDSNNVSGAKNTIIYAIIGLVIVALAQFIVHFVINTAGDAV